MRNYIHGELSEWSKVQHSKCCVPKRNLGFESLTLRQKSPVNSRVCWTFLFCLTPWIFRFSRWNGVRIGRFCVRTACFFSRKSGSNPVLLFCPARLHFPSGSRNHLTSEEAFPAPWPAPRIFWICSRDGHKYWRSCWNPSGRAIPGFASAARRWPAASWRSYAVTV